MNSYFVWRRKVAATILLGFCSAPACSPKDDGPPPTGGASGGSGGTDPGASGGAAPGGGGVVSGGSGGEGLGGEGLGGEGGSDMDPPVAPTGLPSLLSEAGLYESDMVTLAPGVRPFRPVFQLWTDHAEKRRWIWLPDGEQIDTSEMEYWQYPVGTRLYKEFVRDDVRVETRILQKRPNGGWWMLAYQWREDMSDADAVPDGVVDASGTPHDIPDVEQCQSCHLRLPDKVLGFSAIQLAHETEPDDPSEWTLARLEAEGRLTESPPAIEVPGDATSRAVLGYLHANCGHCHNPRSSVSSRLDLQLWLRTDSLETVEGTPTYASLVGQAINLPDGPSGATLRVDPGSPETSATFLRFDSRGEEYSMPPLGTKEVDPAGRDLLEAWIESLQ